MMHRIDMRLCAYIQIAIIICAIMAANLAPPPRGAILLVSMTGLPAGVILNHATAAGAAPLRSGPFAASLVVFGDRGRLLAAGLPAGIIALSSSDALCGKRGTGGAGI